MFVIRDCKADGVQVMLSELSVLAPASSQEALGDVEDVSVLQHLPASLLANF